MDPLGMILETLSGYFTPPFLIFTLVIGYLMFFLFFYRTEYWNSVEWAERFFFGFMVGLFSMIICSFISLPLAFLLFALYLQHLFAVAFYFIPTFFLVFLVLLRAELGVPLSSRKANDYLRAFVANHRSYWPYLLITVSVVTYLWLGWNNPFFDDASRSLWFGFILILNLTVFLSACALTWLVVQLSSIPAKISTVAIVELPKKVLGFYFCSFLRKKKELLIKEEKAYWV